MTKEKYKAALAIIEAFGFKEDFLLYNEAINTVIEKFNLDEDTATDIVATVWHVKDKAEDQNMRDFYGKNL